MFMNKILLITSFYFYIWEDIGKVQMNAWISYILVLLPLIIESETKYIILFTKRQLEMV